MTAKMEVKGVKIDESLMKPEERERFYRENGRSTKTIGFQRWKFPLLLPFGTALIERIVAELPWNGVVALPLLAGASSDPHTIVYLKDGSCAGVNRSPGISTNSARTRRTTVSKSILFLFPSRLALWLTPLGRARAGPAV